MTDQECRIISQVGALEHECSHQAIVWQLHQHKGVSYAPPLFRMEGVELPIVPRVRLTPVHRSSSLGKPRR